MMNGPAEKKTDQRSDRPRDAATLVIVDSTTGEPRVLMGRRHPNQIFLPNKFVFPGGRSELSDHIVPSTCELSDHDVNKLLYDMKGQPSLRRARALALAALRETYEETGLLIGNGHASHDVVLPSNAQPIWHDFFAEGVRPALSPLTFLARAITPPGRPRRYDTRFFFIDAVHIAKRTEPKDDELSGVDWFTVDELRGLDMPNITRAIIEDLAEHLAGNAEARALWPVPFYYFKAGTFERALVR